MFSFDAGCIANYSFEDSKCNPQNYIFLSYERFLAPPKPLINSAYNIGPIVGAIHVCVPFVNTLHPLVTLTTPILSKLEQSRQSYRPTPVKAYVTKGED